MLNKLTEEELAKIPALNSTESIPVNEKIIVHHMFVFSSDWYVAEYGDGTFFGYVILNNDFQNAEWGYFSLDELDEALFQGFLEVDRDMYWKPRQFKEVMDARLAKGS